MVPRRALGVLGALLLVVVAVVAAPSSALAADASDPIGSGCGSGVWEVLYGPTTVTFTSPTHVIASGAVTVPSGAISECAISHHVSGGSTGRWGLNSSVAVPGDGVRTSANPAAGTYSVYVGCSSSCSADPETSDIAYWVKTAEGTPTPTSAQATSTAQAHATATAAAAATQTAAAAPTNTPTPAPTDTPAPTNTPTLTAPQVTATAVAQATATAAANGTATAVAAGVVRVDLDVLLCADDPSLTGQTCQLTGGVLPGRDVLIHVYAAGGGAELPASPYTVTTGDTGVGFMDVDMPIGARVVVQPAAAPGFTRGTAWLPASETFTVPNHAAHLFPEFEVGLADVDGLRTWTLSELASGSSGGHPGKPFADPLAGFNVLELAPGGLATWGGGGSVSVQVYSGSVEVCRVSDSSDCLPGTFGPGAVYVPRDYGVAVPASASEPAKLGDVAAAADPTATPIPATANPAPATATPVPPTATPVVIYEPATATAVAAATATAVAAAEPTSTPTPGPLVFVNGTATAVAQATATAVAGATQQASATQQSIAATATAGAVATATMSAFQQGSADSYAQYLVYQAATATAQAQATAQAGATQQARFTATAQAQATTQAQLTATAQTYATQQAQASATAQARATSTAQAQATATAQGTPAPIQVVISTPEPGPRNPDPCKLWELPSSFDLDACGQRIMVPQKPLEARLAELQQLAFAREPLHGLSVIGGFPGMVWKFIDEDYLQVCVPMMQRSLALQGINLDAQCVTLTAGTSVYGFTPFSISRGLAHVVIVWLWWCFLRAKYLELTGGD